MLSHREHSQDALFARREEPGTSTALFEDPSRQDVMLVEAREQRLSSRNSVASEGSSVSSGRKSPRVDGTSPKRLRQSLT